MYRSLFPKDQETPRAVRLRLVQLMEAHTVVQLLDDPQERWTFVSSRFPDMWPLGTEITVTFTPMELEYLQGKRELGT